MRIYQRLMSPKFFTSAPVHRNLTDLDRSLFSASQTLLAARFPASQTTHYRNLFKGDLFNEPKLSSVLADPSDPTQRILLFNASKQSELSQEAQDTIRKEQLDLTQHVMTVDYDYWTSDQMIDAVLPEDALEGAPKSFNTVGHVAQLNLRDEYLPYKHIIGQIILDKNNQLRTVINKLDIIDNEFRYFQMEVLAGEPDFNVTLSQSNCRFQFDFSKVYWNTRLHTEHQRMVDLFQPDQIIADAFAGVGPFAVPAGKKGCGVLANDLNPKSTEALRHNIKINKVENRVRAYEMDAKEFIQQAVLDAWHNPFPAAPSKPARRSKSKPQPPAPEVSSPPKKLIDHFVMNLPATAIEFLGAFRGAYAPLKALPEFEDQVYADGKARTPLVHCYCFSKELDGYEKDLTDRATHYFGQAVNKDSVEDFAIHLVRSVAPAKDMYRLQFRLPIDALL